MNKKMIRYIVGSIIMLEAALLLLPILTAIVYGEWNTLRVFAGSALFCIVAGALLRGKKPENTTIFSVEGYVSVALCWVALSICGAIPLCVSGVLQNPFDAFFESKETRKLEDVSTGFTYFKNNDMLLAKITPCFENGKAGIARNLKNGIGFGSTEYIVIRADNSVVYPEWIFYHINTCEFID